MPRKPRRVSSAPDAVEGADARQSPNVQKGLSLDGLHVSPLSPTTRMDAVAVVELRRQRGILGAGYAASAVVLEAMGLIRDEEKPAQVNPLSVACPRCGVEAKFPCKPLRGLHLHDPHGARLTAAREAAGRPPNHEES